MADKREMAREKAARLLRKQGSASSLLSQTDVNKLQTAKLQDKQRQPGSVSTISFMDEPGHEYKPMIKYENSYHTDPTEKFPYSKVHYILKDTLEQYLSGEQYDAELCKQMSKTISEVVKGRVKEISAARYKVICLVHIGELKDQGMRVGSRCLWDPSNDSFSTFEFRNESLFALGSVYGVYYE